MLFTSEQQLEPKRISPKHKELPGPAREGHKAHPLQTGQLFLSDAKDHAESS